MNLGVVISVEQSGLADVGNVDEHFCLRSLRDNRLPFSLSLSIIRFRPGHFRAFLVFLFVFAARVHCIASISVV